MNRTLFRCALSSVIALTMTGVLMAQGNPPTTTPQTPPQTTPPRGDQSTAQRSGQTVTIVGCLEQGKDVAALRSSEKASENADDFFLTRVTMPGAGAATPTGGSPTTGTVGSATSAAGTTGTSKPSATAAGGAMASAMSGSDAVYKISGLDKDQLQPHLNHQVEIQGRLSSSGAGSAAGAAAAGAGASATPKVSELHATSIKMVSASCRAARPQ
jgi:hypothetical protein